MTYGSRVVARTMWRLTFSLACIAWAVFGPGQAVPARCIMLSQAGPWKVTRVVPPDGAARFCRATAPMTLAVGELSQFRLSMDIGADGHVVLTEQIDEPVPNWQAYGEGEATGKKNVKGCRFWFDDRAMCPMTYEQENATGITRYDLGGNSHFLEELATSRTLRLDLRPVGVSEQQRSRDGAADGPSALSLVGTSQLARQLQSCLASLGDPDPRAVVEVYEQTDIPAPPVSPTVVERLAKARQACRQARSEDLDGQAMASLQLGLAAVDALRPGEAREAFAQLRQAVARGATMTPAIRRGLGRFAELLVLDERLDEAFAVAKALPENETLLSSIAVSRGDYAGAEQWLVAGATRILGRPVAGWTELSFQTVQDVPVELLGGVAPAMRQLFLRWGMGALGQEGVLIQPRCGNCVYPTNGVVPTVAAANRVAAWVDGDMLREGAPDTVSGRRDLGLAALLRGLSLLRGGYLVSVKSELVYALFELQGVAGEEGLALWTRVALAGLAAAQGRASEALGQATEVAAAAEALVGRESFPWIEATAMQSEAARRVGDLSTALAAARAGLKAAASCLPGEHSLVYRLKRILAQVLLDQGQCDAAGSVLAEALGLPRIPVLSAEQLRETNARLHALRPPDRELPEPFGVDLAGLKQAQESAREALRRNTQDPQARYDILATRLGLPSLSGKLAAAARFERRQYAGPLLQLEHQLQKTPEAPAVAMLYQALAYDALRTRFGLDMLGTRGENSFGDDLARITRGESTLDFPNTKGTGKFGDVAVQALAESSYTEALNWLSLASMFPGVQRQSLLPGESLDGLERGFEAIHTLWLSQSGRQGDALLQSVLVQVQAATRGEVLANFLTRAMLVGDPSLPEQARHYSQQAVDGELWLRRRRGMLLDATATKDPVTQRLSRRRVLARRLVLSNPYEGVAVSNKFFMHAWGGPDAAAKGFESMTWVGSAKYEFKLDQAREHLEPDAALAVWLPLESCTHLFLIKKDRCAWVIIPKGQVAIGRDVRAIRDSIEAATAAMKEGSAQPAGPAFPAEAAYNLYTTLFGSVADSLADVRHLYAVQMGVVGGIPLSLLVTQKPDSNQDPRWLADRFAITRVPALVNPMIVKRRQPSDKPERPLLAAGDPVVGDQRRAHQAGLATAVRSVSNIDRYMAPLPETRREMGTVAGLLGLPGSEANEDIYAGARATPRHILDRLRRGRFKYLLFATHGISRFEDVGEPALVLSSDSGHRGPDDDGLLRTSDIVGLDLDSDLVILSACETSPSGEDGADPLAGLASAFLIAGARSVISSQWIVVTDAAEAVSTSVIARMRSGQASADALQEAGRALRAPQSGMRWIHPAYWAPYELVSFFR